MSPAYEHAWSQFLAAVRREIPSWEPFALEAAKTIRASRSSPSVPGNDSGIREALGSASALVDEVLRFASTSEGREIPFDLHPAIRSMKAAAEKTLDALCSVPSRRALSAPVSGPGDAKGGAK